MQLNATGVEVGVNSHLNVSWAQLQLYAPKLLSCICVFWTQCQNAHRMRMSDSQNWQPIERLRKLQYVAVTKDGILEEVPHLYWAGMTSRR